MQGGALGAAPSVIGDLADAGRRPAPSGCRLCKSPLVWTGVGAAVLGGVAIVLAVTSGARPPPIVTIDGRDFGR